MTTGPNEHECYLQQVIEHQGQLYGFVLALLADRALADEALQEVNLALLRKEAEYQPGTNFFAWARQVVFYQVLTFRKRRRRDHLVFDDDLLQLLVVDAQQATAAEPNVQRHALRHCLKTLSQRQQELLARRYGGTSVETLASEAGRSAASISQTLYRLRTLLKRCIERTLAGDAEYECS